MKRPWVIAHRGASALAPENTMAAFAEAIRQKADGIELDVWKCASGEVVVTHNKNTRLLSGKGGDIEKLTYKELKKFDFGAFKGNRFRGEKIPRLEEVFDLCKDMELINVEIKGVNLNTNGIELAVAERILKFNLLRKVVISSFNPAILLRLQSLNPALKLGLLFYEKSPLALRRAWSAKLLKPYSLHPSAKLLEAKMVQRAQKKNSKVIAWTINTPSELEACMQCQVDGMITDNPVWMVNALR